MEHQRAGSALADDLIHLERGLAELLLYRER